jgi:hypothetical protein
MDDVATSHLTSVQDAFNLLTAPRYIPHTHFITTQTVKVPESFIVTEVVNAVTTFLKGVFGKLIIEMKNLCGDNVSVVGSKGQLQTVLRNTIESIEHSFTFGIGRIAIIIHELRRPSDATLLPKGALYEGSSSLEKEALGVAIRAKYIAISVRGGALARTEDPKSGEVSYYDDGIIVKTGAQNAVIYLSKSGA